MLIKRMDSKQEEVGELKGLLEGKLTLHQRFLIERELKAITSGVQGEEDSSYYIDFYFKDSKNWAVIHDLRLEHKGQVAQIDHLLINRFFDIYVLESKNYSYKIKITPEGEFQAYTAEEYIGIPSPIEQNKRHIRLLDRFLKGREILPRRIGISIKPRFKNFILISSKALIVRPPEERFNTSRVIRADSLRTKIDEEVDKGNPLKDMTLIAKCCTSSTLKETVKRLASFHTPKKPDFRKKFGLPAQPLSNRSDMSKYLCVKCNNPISERVMKFCEQNKARLGGKLYCFDCQKGV